MRPNQLESLRAHFNDEFNTYGYVSTRVPILQEVEGNLKDVPFVTIRTEDIGLTLSRLASLKLLEGFADTPLQPGDIVLTHRYASSVYTPSRDKPSGQIFHFLTFEDVGPRAVEEQ